MVLRLSDGSKHYTGVRVDADGKSQVQKGLTLALAGPTIQSVRRGHSSVGAIRLRRG